MDRAGARLIAGLGFVAAGGITVLGFITAEALYPGYSAADQTISALGTGDAPAASRTVFNAAMILAGLLTVVAAFGLHRIYERRLLTAVIVITGTGGLVGVGTFPADTGLPHFVAAVLAFGGVGVGALVVAATVRGPFRYLSAVLGVFELIAFVSFLTLGGNNPLGVGGLERWVAYLAAIWAIAFGGYQFPDGSEPG